MIFQRRQHSHAQVLPLFAGLDIHLAPLAVLSGAAEGLVWTDDPARPRAALVHTGSRYYLAGDPLSPDFNAGLRRLFADTLYPQALADGKEAFVLYYGPGWEGPVTAEILAGKDPIQDGRQVYELDGAALQEALHPDWQAQIPDGFTLRRVDAALLEEAHLMNLDEIVEEILSEGTTVEAYLQDRFGFCLVKNHEVAAWCFSEYNWKDRCEIGIATVEEYRRQGLAVAVGRALIEHARSQGIARIGWHCWTSNTPSIATALKLGFRKVQEFPVYFAYYAAALNLAVNGNIRFREADYRAAAGWYERAFTAGEAPSWAYWNAACACARLGEGQAALERLQAALVHGFHDLERLQTSVHLEQLRSDQALRPAYNELVARLQAEEV
jgi:RimJ/RimL family protein N-acetyltransferase